MPEPTTPAPPTVPPSCAGCVGCGGPDCIERADAPLTRVEIDLNIRVLGNLTRVDPLDADGPLTVGQNVEVYEPESGLTGPGQVTLIDSINELIYLAVDWAALTEVAVAEPDEADATETDIDRMMAAGIPVQIVTGPPPTTGGGVVQLACDLGCDNGDPCTECRDAAVQAGCDTGIDTAQHACANCEGVDPESCLMNPGRAEPGSETATATVTVAIHAPDDANATRWARSIARLVGAEFGRTMRLDISITTPAQPASRDTLRPAITAALRSAARDCDGECDLTRADCGRQHPIQVAAWTRDVVSEVHGTVDAIAEVVEGVVDGEVQQLASLAVNAANALVDERRHYRIACEENARLRTRAEEAEAKIAAARSARDSAAASAATLLAGVIRVRQMTDAWEQQLPDTIRTATAVDAIRTALTAPHGPAGQGDGGGK